MRKESSLKDYEDRLAERSKLLREAETLKGKVAGLTKDVERLRLSDNRVVERPLGEIGIEIEKRRAGATPVVFGEEGVYL